MAESESGQDRSEEPTEKRRRESREKGQIARSKELSTLAVTLGVFGGLLIFGGSIGQHMLELMRRNFELSREVLVEERYLALYLLASGVWALKMVLPLFGMLLIGDVLGHIGLGGWL